VYRERRQSIIDAAFRMVQASDVPAISVTDIIKVTGLSTCAFYREFASKDDLVLQMCRSEFERMAVRLEERRGRGPHADEGGRGVHRRSALRRLRPAPGEARRRGVDR
jgi:AcrR family transcriptional regulator